MISFNKVETGFVLPEPGKLKTWLKHVVQSEGKSLGDLNYLFVDDKYLLEINQKFLDHDTLTDIITFPLSQSSDIISGEVYLSIERIKENAINLNVDFERELQRVMVHGLLHLIGYDDGTDDEKNLIRSKEDYYLNLQP